MTRFTTWVLAHKRLVLVFWLVVTVGAVVALQPAGRSLSQEFGVPGEGYDTNRALAEIYGNGGDVAPLVPVVQLPVGTTVDSPGVTAELAATLDRAAASSAVTPGESTVVPTGSWTTGTSGATSPPLP